MNKLDLVIDKLVKAGFVDEAIELFATTTSKEKESTAADKRSLERKNLDRLLDKAEDFLSTPTKNNSDPFIDLVKLVQNFIKKHKTQSSVQEVGSENKPHPRFEHIFKDVQATLDKVKKAGEEVPDHTGKIVRKLDAVDSELKKLLISLGRFDLA